MLRINKILQEIKNPIPISPIKNPLGPVVIWNLIRRCNLTCKHCYSISADTNFKGELSTAQVFKTMDDLKNFKVPVLILSGGEPLLRDDIFKIARRAKNMGFYTALSTNGTLITDRNIKQITDIGFDYLGISIDGVQATHDVFRQKEGAYQESINGIRLCKKNNIKVGLRFTQTTDNQNQLKNMLQLMDDEGVDKFYYSHLNFAGRGSKNRADIAEFKTTRESLDLLFSTCIDNLNKNNKEFVTGNNDADGVYLYLWVKKNYPKSAEHVRQKLEQWAGNSSGINISNIDNTGQVHPDTMWWNYNLGNVKDREFSEIWQDVSDPLMAGLKQKPRPVKGRCYTCSYKKICDGNTRTRAYIEYNDAWAEDPGCYLTDKEIG
ncbi:MAG: heme d1 biosynthesis radical SAM protein NirJ [Gammaproteobacteria bacterium]|nr:MAG: heme d1 biosynthesis radical SAM protein NirJ [Gammaproteobacteria bacterium]